MKELEEFVDKARKTFDDLPFISDYLNKNLKHKELVGTYLYNQTLIIQKLEFECREAGLTKDIPEIEIQKQLDEAWKAEWPYEAEDVSKPWVQPSMMFATQNWAEHIDEVKSKRHKLIAHLYATHSEIMINQGTSILKERLTQKFQEFYKEHKDEMLEEIKVSWDMRNSMAHDLEAHKEHMEEILPRIALFKIAAREIMEDKSGLNDMSGGAKDETEDMKVRAELMKNAVTVREAEVKDLPEEYQKLVKDDMAEGAEKRKLEEREMKKAMDDGKVRTQ